MLGGVNCNLLGHKVDRHHVWHDGLDHRATCKRCGRPIIKRRQEWRLFDTERDTDQRRSPHPRYDKASV